MTRLVKEMGGVPAIQLGHTGRKGSECAPWLGRVQLPPEHPDGWQVSGPSDVPYGGVRPYPVHPLSTGEIADIHRAHADAARRALDAGFEWMALHFPVRDARPVGAGRSRAFTCAPSPAHLHLRTFTRVPSRRTGGG
jgi:hypothetical protein